MAFWFLAIGLSVAVSLILIRRFWRQDTEQDGPEQKDLDLYKAQLAEIERDQARGLVDTEEAGQMRIEISRRLLATDARVNRSAPNSDRPPSLAYSLITIAVIILGTAGLYLHLGANGQPDLELAKRIKAAKQLASDRPSQEDAEASVSAAKKDQADAGVDADFLELMTRLRNTVAKRPNDLKGHRLLVENEARIGNFTAAYHAQERVLMLLGDAATGNAYAQYGDLLVLAAGGFVSKKAENALREALKRDPNNALSQYYIGLLHAQTGRPDLAFYTWRNLSARKLPDLNFASAVREQMEIAAMQAGLMQELERIPPLQAAANGGPSEEDIAAAMQMPAADRAEMIAGMVAQLSDRLAREGGPLEEWGKLINAYIVLGQKSDAERILNEARAVFKDSNAALDMLDNLQNKLKTLP